MQQQYLQHALIAEQEEYIREGIEWEKINIQDNKECVALIENKPGGILTLLNEECVLPRGSDQSFLDKLLQQHAKHPFFIKPKVQKKPHFIIRHYASEVSYVVTDFLNKNKDRLYPHLVDRLTKSKNNFVANLFNTFSPASKQPMAEQFKIQLATLNKILSETEQHYVRCISPNKEKYSPNKKTFRKLY